jgi:muramidase (phage lysozyme)
MIAWSEIGQRLLAASDNGYNVLVGGGLFEGYSDHPRIKIKVREGLWSTAAGRYQILARFYDYYAKKLGLSGFYPDVQDALALDGFIKDCRAIIDIDEGRTEAAIRKCARIWASFPGAGYGQHENKTAKLLDAYVAAGGTFGKTGDA